MSQLPQGPGGTLCQQIASNFRPVNSTLVVLNKHFHLRIEIFFLSLSENILSILLHVFSIQ